jgi:hypothetical protein
MAGPNDAALSRRSRPMSDRLHMMRHGSNDAATPNVPDNHHMNDT